MPDAHSAYLTALCIELEHFETDPWAARAILKKESLTPHVVDPCVGSGILAHAAFLNNCRVTGFDIHDWKPPLYWGSDEGTIVADWLSEDPTITALTGLQRTTCFMNPPFSKAEEFVEKAIQRGFAKIICFQRFAWYESGKRKEFWDRCPPSRVWICGDRATCWRHDLPTNDKGERLDPITGRKLANTSTAHAWFVWDKNAPQGTLLGRIYKADVTALCPTVSLIPTAKNWLLRAVKKLSLNVRIRFKVRKVLFQVLSRRQTRS